MYLIVSANIVEMSLVPMYRTICTLVSQINHTEHHTMSTTERVKKDYDISAATYNDYSSLPSGQLESQLIKIALGDCTGLSVLDLGGGTGVHALEAVDLGASSVDIVDISPGMLRIGQEAAERSLSREQSTLRFFEADVSRSLSHLPLRGEGYDIVMANWIFSFADSIEVLEGMFRNVIGHLKPGGLFVGVRDADLWSPALKSAKYGASCKWVERIPGGARYYCMLHSTPPIEFEGVCMEVIYSGSTKVYERFGIGNVEVVPYERAGIVKKDPEFWRLFLERPYLAVVRALKELGKEKFDTL